MSRDPETGLPPHDPTEYTARELASLMEEGRPLQAMDVRAPEKVAQGRLDGIPGHRYKNIRGSKLKEIHDLGSTELDPEIPVVVVCGHGEDSKILASHLRNLGLDARSLTGGLVEWMRLTLPRLLDPPQGVDRLIQFDRVGKGCLGYLLESRGEAVIVDPPLHSESYLEALEEGGARLVGVADTHVHADYVSGAPLLAQRLGVPYYLHPSDAVYPYDGTPGKVEFEAISEGSVIHFGDSSLQVMHTPGHTEGSVTFLAENRVALTGDFLLVESIGRPDLGGTAEEWTDRLWDSVARAIRAFDDGMAVYPAHYASDSERRMGRAVGIPFGTLLRENEILRIQDPEVFRWTILDRKAVFPEAYRRIKGMNLGLEPIVQTEVEVLEEGRNECALGGLSGS